MRNTDLPLFEKHYMDQSEAELSARRKSNRSTDKGMTALEVGTDETQGMIARHNRFLLRYTNDAIRTEHATWLLGLSACSSNDELTHPLLDQCIARGMTHATIVHLGLATDSIEAARYLTRAGVDWATQTTRLHTNASRVVDANSPHSALIDHHIPERSAGRYYLPREENSVFLAATGNLDVPPLGFVEGILESGQIAPDWRMETPALGLKDGHATWFSHCIATGQLTLAAQALKHFKNMPQQALDEGLLACAMLAEYDNLGKDETKILASCAKTLRNRGANPDASFEFGVNAFEALTGTHYHSFFNQPGEALRATTREWGLRAALSQPLTRSHDSLYCPSPWPKAPEGVSSWAQLALTRHAHSRRTGEVRQEMIKRVFDLPRAPTLADLLSNVDAACFQPSEYAAKWSALDALLDSKIASTGAGTVDYETAMHRVLAWGGCSKREKTKVLPTVEKMEKRMEDWWQHPRLERVLAWMSEDDQARARPRIAEFVKAATDYASIKRPTDADQEAVALAYTAFLSTAASPEPTRIAPRRTL